MPYQVANECQCNGFEGMCQAPPAGLTELLSNLIEVIEVTGARKRLCCVQSVLRRSSSLDTVVER